MSDSITVNGFFEKHAKGFGFLRQANSGLTKSADDVYVPAGFANRFGLEDGTFVEGNALLNSGKPAPALQEVTKLNGVKPMDFRFRKTAFAKGDAVTPEKWLQLEMPGGPQSNRIIDIVTPLGKGQRALIAAPPRSGKTVLMENIINTTLKKFPEMKAFILLIDERPEEVTHFKRSFPDATLLASSNDNMPTDHIALASQTFAMARSMVEMGQDVIIFLDSLTRLCRAHNSQSRGRRTLSGGVDSEALTEPKKLFGSARQIDNGGSLTVVATALIQTDSQMDEVIYQEFKGTGNLELVLDRDLSDRKLYPAVNINLSGTRNEHVLFGPEVTSQVNSLRRALASCSKEEGLRQLLSLVDKYPTNEDFLKLQK
jgi:transcription termination factor Rho